MEMTGLDVNKEVPIEVAALITDYQFNELASYHAVIRQPQEYLDGMDEWNQLHHGKSGLTAQVPNGKAPELVETELVSLVGQHFRSPAILAGNSIGQDRLFIERYFPNLAQKLHYRVLDVSSWKVILNTRYQLKYEKKNTHRALDDIRESIAELSFYLDRCQFEQNKSGSAES